MPTVYAAFHFALLAALITVTRAPLSQPIRILEAITECMESLSIQCFRACHTIVTPSNCSLRNVDGLALNDRKDKRLLYQVRCWLVVVTITC